MFGKITKTLTLLAIAAIIFGCGAYGLSYYRSSSSGHSETRLSLDGNILTTGGVSKITVEYGPNKILMACANACDSFDLKFSSNADHYKLELYDEGGNCLLCQDAYLSNGYLFDDSVSLKGKLSFERKLTPLSTK